MLIIPLSEYRNFFIYSVYPLNCQYLLFELLSEGWGTSQKTSHLISLSAVKVICIFRNSLRHQTFMIVTASGAIKLCRDIFTEGFCSDLGRLSKEKTRLVKSVTFILPT